MTVSGCISSKYEEERFSSDYVRVFHSKQRCNDARWSAATKFPDADLVIISEHGIGRFVATRAAWETLARQLAAELDADMARIRPCDSEGSFEHVKIEVWRTRGFKPITEGLYRSDSGTLMAPPQSTYGTRIKDIFECLEQAQAASGSISPDNMQRLGQVDATEFFASGHYFSGYARVDKYFRPTRTGDLRLSMIYSDRGRADWAAGIYQKLSSDEKQHFADRYLICFLDREYYL